ncbi:MAG: hypothetical protein C4305_02800 [Thermoleophilia bacterium]
MWTWCRVSRRALLLGALALALSSAAGASLAAEKAPPPVPTFLGKTAQAKSFRFSFVLTMEGGGTALPGGRPVSFEGRGGIDTRAQSGQLTLDLGPLAALLAGPGGGAPVPSSVEVVVARNVLYVRLPALARQVAPGAEWLKLDPSTFPGGMTGGANVGRLAQVSPRQLLAALVRAITTTRLGSATVRGVSTTRYRITVDLPRLAAGLPKAQRADVLSAIRQLDLRTLPIDAWVDGAGYVRRIATALTLKPQGVPSFLRFTVDLYDFNKPVRVTVPPEGKTVDGSQLLQPLLGGSGRTGTTGP